MTQEEAIKYLQQLYPNGGHCWLDEQRIEAVGMAVRALQEEPVSEDLEEAARKIATRHSHITGDTYYANDAWFFKKGAQWQAEQFEKNRLAHCDELTPEQARVESDFVTQHLIENNRTPTFIDAIKYGKNIVLAELEKIIKDKEEAGKKLKNPLDLSDRTPEQAEAFISSLGALGYETSHLMREYRQTGKIQL